LGIINAGSVAESVLYLFNDTNGRLSDLSFKAEGLSVVEAPKELASHQVSKLVLKWNPSLNEKKTLQSKLVVEGQETY
jgi:hypothetical protein